MCRILHSVYLILYWAATTAAATTTITITPNAITSTITSTIISTSSVQGSAADTAFTTVTDTIHTTKTFTITHIIQSKVTVTATSTPYYTVPEPAGFTPVALEPAYLAAQKRSLPGRYDRRARDVSNNEFRDTISSMTSSGTSEITETVTAPTPTSTVTVTQTVTVTPIVPRQASTTSTVTKTITTTDEVDIDTTTTITTVTTTKTVVGPRETVYAVCQNSANIVSQGPNGSYISGAWSNVNPISYFYYVNDPVECCSKCAATETCGFSALYHISPNLCILFDANPQDCDPTKNVGGFGGNYPFEYVHVSNSGCGQASYVPSDQPDNPNWVRYSNRGP